MYLNHRSIWSVFTKITISPFSLILLSSLFITATSNLSFIEHFSQEYIVQNNVAFLVALMTIIWALNTVIIAIVYSLLPLRWALAVILLVSVTCAYFADNFGVVIDVEMIRNSLQTNAAEASDLLTLNLVMRLLLLGVVPIVLINSVTINAAKNPAAWLRKVKTVAGLLAVSVLVIALSMGVFSAQFSSFIRQHKELRYYINPIQAIYSAGKYLGGQFKTSGKQTYSTLSNNSQIPLSDIHRELVIMVVGETVRADHWGLNGYKRNTTPLLSQEENVINYPNISSCGTSTAISVPCMFSFSGRDDFDVDTSAKTENAFDVLAKAKGGLSVLWRDNNSDSKGVAIRQQFEDFRTSQNNTLCDDECRDVGMLVGLQEYIDQQAKDIFIVLHQMGSHGPAYFKRYPKAFEIYRPACQTAELSQCSDEEIINAYDNTIVYTDYFLSQVIALLKNNTEQFETSMIYVSDHGESMGENGIYLHGLPYSFAPDSQTKVPLVVWTDVNSDIDIAATRQLAEQENSHDAIAKTLITLFELETDVKFNEANNLLKFKQRP
ncbi:phosphoethanolamine transferase [Paraglaciecola sp.]|uniref:phosphoethanolamine transferase n=1 Tax=Paraglaciecola sp. TaxID=1920173 RepID=UPI00273FD947|nr:phosphoethanolamine--lipid A transferase [Paraglaciecola sp.]MDP5031370.1 phosphoethanolamine--lipid A transferase [Paraglaciecola sp.]